MPVVARPRHLLPLLATLLGAALPRPVPPPPVTVRWIPERPVQGSLIWIAADRQDSADAIIAIEGELAGERLHFERDSSGSLNAVGGVPVDATESLPLRITVARPGVVDTLFLRVPITRGRFRMESLRVEPRFTEPPDSALAQRIAQEAMLVSEVYRRAHDTRRLWRTGFDRPRRSQVSSGYGNGRQFNGVVQSRHLGVDFRGRVGDPVRAANDGVVVLTGDFYYSGNCIFLDHGGGLVTAYLHLSATLVATGDTVRKGQTIGRVGATGRVTGPHLHWIARYGRISVNPLSLLDLGAAPAPPTPPAPTSATATTSLR